MTTREIFQKLGLKQHQLARRTQLSSSHISRMMMHRLPFSDSVAAEATKMIAEAESGETVERILPEEDFSATHIWCDKCANFRDYDERDDGYACAHCGHIIDGYEPVPYVRQYVFG